MPDALTPNLGLTKPEVGGSDDMWGEKLNGNFDILDAAIPVGGFPVPATALPLMDNPAAIGVSNKYAREDHVHPKDTSKADVTDLNLKAPIASPTFTGDPKAPTPAPGDNDTSIATTAFVTAAVTAAGGVVPSNVNPSMDGVAAPGVSALYSRGDHVHPSDTSRVAKAGDTMSGALIVTPKGSTFGGPSGTVVPGAVVPADANIKMYDGGGGNWSGFGCDPNGVFWIRTGLSGTPIPGFSIDTSQFVRIDKTPTAAAHAARKDYVDGQITNLGLLVRYDAAQALTVAQQVQARENIFAAPLDAFAYSGLQVNGAFEIAQEFVGNPVTAAVGGSNLCDIFTVTSPAAPWVVNAWQGAGAMAQFTFRNFLSVTGTTVSSVAAGDVVQIMHAIEGNRSGSLMFGVTQARSITVAFWVLANVASVIGVALRNGAQNRSCVQAVTVNAANTWEYKVVTFPGDTAGTWTRDNTVGMYLSIVPLCGTTFRTSTLGAWQAGNFLAPNTIGNPFPTNGQSFLLAHLMVLPGLQAPPSDRQFYISRKFIEELSAVQRYWAKTYPYGTIPGAVSSAGQLTDAAGAATPSRPLMQWFFPQAMRVAPTVVTFSPATGTAGVCRNLNTNTDITTVLYSAGDSSATIYPNATPAAGDAFGTQFAVSARM